MYITTFTFRKNISSILIAFLVLVFISGINTLNAQSITDFNKKKPIMVSSASGSPTISKAQPFKITGGNANTTGTGKIVLDWTNISSKSDIAIYDENDNLLNYYFEAFDATNDSAVIWVYRSWARDGSVQAQIAYGNGPADQSVSANTVFDQETDLVGGWLLNEASGNALDVTSNSYDGTLYNGTTQGAKGQVGGAYAFDGTDDYVDIDSDNQNLQDWTVSGWISPDDWSDASRKEWLSVNENRTTDRPLDFVHENGDIKHYRGEAATNVMDYDVSGKSGWHHYVVTQDRVNSTTVDLVMYFDGSQVSTSSGDYEDMRLSLDLLLGRIARDQADRYYWKGSIDNIRIYSSVFSSDEISATYDATKSSPDFFEQGAPLGSDETLPVELLYFEVECLQGSSAKISWSTATETNNDRFELMLSKDGQHFETVKVIQGTGNSNQRQNYEAVVDIKNQMQYVRLKQVDFDGQTELFAPEDFNCDLRNIKVNIYPNPVREQLTVDFARIPESGVNVSVFTPQGKCVYKAAEKPETNRVKLDLADLPGGIYFINIRKGNHQIIKKFTK